MSKEKKGFHFINRKQLREITGLSASTIWRLEKAKDFPPRYQLSKGRVSYKSTDIIKWLNSRKKLNEN